ncbi:MAG: flagellar hook assembly protein FlgD [Candidatus Eisenbacteria bacterium]|nr:flagellar hook assembly protein FlgD [Candidatus Eisenbacteria bacterium]
MSTNAIHGTNTAASLGATMGASGASALGKEDFLLLLTAQLRNQDPMQPIQNEAFVAQLAQFSSLEQMQNMNDGMATSILLNQSVNNSLTTGLIGRDVEARGDQFTLSAGGKVDLGFNLSGAAGSVKVEVVDSSGKVVATVKSGSMGEGSHTVAWDGNGADGQPAPAGEYTFKVTATDAKGAAVPAETLVRGRVTGVKFSHGQTYLLVGDRSVSLSDVTQIVEAPVKK